MVRWLRWHCPPDTGFEIRALAVWGRARYLSVTEAPHNTDFHTWMGKKHFCFFQTAETGNRTPNSGVKGSGANHYPSLTSFGVRFLWPSCYRTVIAVLSTCDKGFRSKLNFIMASRLFNAIGKIGVGIAIAGGVVNTALYNGIKHYVLVFLKMIK